MGDRSRASDCERQCGFEVADCVSPATEMDSVAWIGTRGEAGMGSFGVTVLTMDM